MTTEEKTLREEEKELRFSFEKDYVPDYGVFNNLKSNEKYELLIDSAIYWLSIIKSRDEKLIKAVEGMKKENPLVGSMSVAESIVRVHQATGYNWAVNNFLKILKSNSL